MLLLLPADGHKLPRLAQDLPFPCSRTRVNNTITLCMRVLGSLPRLRTSDKEERPDAFANQASTRASRMIGNSRTCLSDSAFVPSRYGVRQIQDTHDTELCAAQSNVISVPVL
jgi:hypothetical protein